MQLSVGAKIEVYGDKQLQVSNSAANLERSQAGKPVIANRVVQVARSDRSLILATSFNDSTLCDSFNSTAI